MTASFLNRNLVIASVQTAGQTVPDFQNSDTIPETRPNGGDLIAGDMWYDEDNELLSIYDGTFWIEIGGPGRSNDIYDHIDSISNKLDSIEGSLTSRIDSLMSRVDALDESVSARLDIIETRLDNITIENPQDSVTNRLDVIERRIDDIAQNTFHREGF